MIDSNGYLRCDGCGKALARDLKGEVFITCSKCHRLNRFVFDKPENRVTLEVRG